MQTSSCFCLLHSFHCCAFCFFSHALFPTPFAWCCFLFFSIYVCAHAFPLFFPMLPLLHVPPLFFLLCSSSLLTYPPLYVCPLYSCQLSSFVSPNSPIYSFWFPPFWSLSLFYISFYPLINYIAVLLTAQLPSLHYWFNFNNALFGLTCGESFISCMN